MHLPALNIPDLYLSLWRGTMECDKNDNKDTWDWAVFRDISIWKEHGREVAAATPYIPGSFDRPPRNPAEKMNSGYKAWEYLLYFFGLGPCLFYGRLPHKYWMQYCKLVQGVTILLQDSIAQAEIKESNNRLSEACVEFEELYIQRKAEQIHFAWPSMHNIAHMPHEVLRVGPGMISSQWTMERTIGNLGEEINLHSNPYANIANCGVRRCQINALKAMIPDIDPPAKQPHGALDIGDGFVFLRAKDRTARAVTEAEAEAFQEYLEDQGVEVEESFHPQVTRWARLRLPNGQIARSCWKEELKELNHLQMTRNVKLNQNGSTGFAEIHYFTTFAVHDTVKFVAVGSFYGAPHQELYEQSSRTYVSVQHFRDVDIRVFDAKAILSVVTLFPDPCYPVFFQDGSQVDQYALMQKPGLGIGQKLGYRENDAAKNKAKNVK
ncbi:hypothetical protein BDP27DRAFT_1384101 [Rhodocollybia butyracea]|uniref:Uncharacterized protein n=1 Tax=Rhodocollybia butyracea TaxID=206335 RepID=A0A9P5PPK1_9AGAR|nr:hypothetical protein BDP27DRAFT_1384101 [Rhodocollybia butyracea]